MQIESWAFAVDNIGLALLIERGNFHIRTCKICAGKDGIVVNGEYGLSKILLDAGYNMHTLMSR